MKFAVAVCLELLAVMLVQAKEEMAPPGVPVASRIVNGRPAVPRQLPYMAYIESLYGGGGLFWRCAGSLITRSAVLTRAAWCVYGSCSKWTVRLGSLNRTGEDAHAWSVESVMAMLHPKFNISNHDNNIAIIQLPRLAPVNEFIQPVHLPSSPDVSKYIGRQGIVAGWGYSGTGSGPSDVLRWTEVLVVHNDFCKKFRPDYAVTDRQLCAGSDTMTVGGGDDGAPLVLYNKGRFIQIGLYSAVTASKFNTSHPAIYTRVTSYIDWIKLYTGSD